MSKYVNRLEEELKDNLLKDDSDPTLSDEHEEFPDAELDSAIEGDSNENQEVLKFNKKFSNQLILFKSKSFVGSSNKRISGLPNNA